MKHETAVHLWWRRSVIPALVMVWVFGGALHGPDASTVVRANGADVLVTDGPYVETKEQLGGFSIVDVADLDEALAWAGRLAHVVPLPIEVRPFQD